MRVVIAADYPVAPPNVVGGVQAVVYYTLEHLAGYDDLDLHVVTCEKWVRRRATWEAAANGRWHVHYLPSSSRLPHTLTMLTLDRLRVARAVRALAPDLVHAHGQVTAYPWVAFDAGAPAIVTVHGIRALEAQIDRQRGGALRGQLREWIWNRIEQACLRRARDIVVISPFVGRMIAPYTHARLYPIENPVRECFLRVERAAVVPGRILYVASIQKLKGLADLLRAVHVLRDVDRSVHLHVAGAAAPPYAYYGRYVRELVEELDLSDRVTFLGHLDQAALLSEYAQCAVFCLPSHLEASPVVVAEAMAAACPVVTTVIGGTDHLVVEGETGYRVPPGDPAALADGLRRVLADPACGRRLGQAGREVARARFHPERAAAATHALYRQVAS